MNRRKLFRLYVFLIIFTTFTILVRTIYDLYFNHDKFIDHLKSRNLKSVQLLTGRFLFKNWEFDDLGVQPFKGCEENRCYAFQTMFLQGPLEQADAVVVHGPNLWFMPPKHSYNRRKEQLWLFYSMEPQGLTFCSSHYKLTDLDEWFNLTATFKFDSDIPVDYKEFRTWNDIVTHQKYVNEFKKLLEIYPNDPKQSILNKLEQSYPDSSYYHKTSKISKRREKASVAWYVSHCETNSRREHYVQELLKYINIDIYGKCSNRFPLNARRDFCKSKTDLKCLNEHLNSYKFYLSFENSLCDDYITEKFWKFYDSNTIFQVNLIPIVKGARQDQYKRATSSLTNDQFYINVDDFKSPKDLADYLKYLDRNQTAYLEYFKWKLDLYDRINQNLVYQQSFNSNYKVSVNYHLKEPFCRLCALLHNQTYLKNRDNQNSQATLSKWFNKHTNCWDHSEQRVFLYKVLQFFGYCF
jgi:hypothetical protein